MTTEVGQTLREARTARGIELDEVERTTKIRVRYLRAMEDERWDLLPGTAYARGFLATYARYLGLDGAALVAEYQRLHEPVDEAEPIPEEMLPERGVIRKPLLRPSIGLLVALLAVVVVVAVLGLTLLDGSGDGGERDAPERSATEPAGSSSGSEATPTTAQRAAAQGTRPVLRLHSTGTVWVCVVDDRGRVLVNGETLSADEGRGPFEARGFEINLGNGALEMSVNGETVEIPDAAEPLGYEITKGGIDELAIGSRPTCA